jgi:dihydrodipicolinate synthase/N-acetylneuraminate lyase
MGNLHRTSVHTDPRHFAVLAGKGEFLFHGLIGGASGAIAALVNM